MKSYITVIACLLASAVTSFAQDVEEHHEAVDICHNLSRSELIIGHGFVPTAQLLSGSERKLQYNSEKYSGAIFATYRFHISKLISLGVAIAYEYESGQYTDNVNNDYYFQHENFGGYYTTHGTFTRSSFTVAPEITFTYANCANGHAQLYSAIGLGYTYCNELLSDKVTNTEYISPYAKQMHANAYVSPFGVRAGGRLSGFFEIGIGYKGLLSYGFTYKI